MSYWRNFQHWLLQKLSLTTSGAASDENYVNMTFLFQWMQGEIWLVEDNLDSASTAANRDRLSLFHFTGYDT